MKTLHLVSQEDISPCGARILFFLCCKKTFLPVSQEDSSSGVTRRHNHKVTPSCKSTLQCSCACLGWPARVVHFEYKSGLGSSTKKRALFLFTCPCGPVGTVRYSEMLKELDELRKITDLRSDFKRSSEDNSCICMHCPRGSPGLRSSCHDLHIWPIYKFPQTVLALRGSGGLSIETGGMSAGSARVCARSFLLLFTVLGACHVAPSRATRSFFCFFIFA